jgi:hypothetical protein
MKINKIFYTHPVFPSKVAMILTPHAVERLKSMGVIPDKAKTLVNPVEGELMSLRLECVKFDNIDNPTVLHFDVDAIREEYIKEIRKKRDEVLGTLDYLQQRAISLGRMNTATSIETDKQALRDITTTSDYNSITEIRHLYTRMPGILLVDYKDKYRNG